MASLLESPTTQVMKTVYNITPTKPTGMTSPAPAASRPLSVSLRPIRAEREYYKAQSESNATTITQIMETAAPLLAKQRAASFAPAQRQRLASQLSASLLAAETALKTPQKAAMMTTPITEMAALLLV